MRNTVRLTEKDLTRLVKRVINEGVTLGFEETPEEYIKNNPNASGTFKVEGGVLNLSTTGNAKSFTKMTCTPNQ